MLYDQNSNPTGVAIVSQNFSRTDSPYDCAGADDFMVPQGRRWKIGEVDVTGINFNGFGATTSENVTFYEDTQYGTPGNPVRNGTFTDLKGQEFSDGSFAIRLPKSLTLKAGTWWVSVVANKSFADGGGEWGWAVNRVIHGSPAMWENPGGDNMGGCPVWGTIGQCIGYTGDFMFDLKGTSR